MPQRVQNVIHARRDPVEMRWFRSGPGEFPARRSNSGSGNVEMDTRRLPAASAEFRQRKLNLFLDARRLTRASPQVVKLGTANVTATLHDNFADDRAVGLKHPFNTFAVRNFANSK